VPDCLCSHGNRFARVPGEGRVLTTPGGQREVDDLAADDRAGRWGDDLVAPARRDECGSTRIPSSRDDADARPAGQPDYRYKGGDVTWDIRLPPRPGSRDARVNPSPAVAPERAEARSKSSTGGHGREV